MGGFARRISSIVSGGQAQQPPQSPGVNPVFTSARKPVQSGGAVATSPSSLLTSPLGFHQGTRAQKRTLLGSI